MRYRLYAGRMMTGFGFDLGLVFDTEGAAASGVADKGLSMVVPLTLFWIRGSGENKDLEESAEYTEVLADTSLSAPSLSSVLSTSERLRWF